MIPAGFSKFKIIVKSKSLVNIENPIFFGNVNEIILKCQK